MSNYHLSMQHFQGFTGIKAIYIKAINIKVNYITVKVNAN